MNESNDIPVNEIFARNKLKDLIRTMWGGHKAADRHKKGSVKIPKQLDLPLPPVALSEPREKPAIKRSKRSPAKQLSLPFRKPPTHRPISTEPEPKLEKPKVISTLFSKKIDMSQPPFYTDADKWYKDNFKREDNIGYTYSVRYVGPTLDDNVFVYSSYPHDNDVKSYNRFYDDREKNMKLWNALAKEYIKKKYADEFAGMSEQYMKLSEIKEVIDELISEELKEVNHTTDSSGKNIIAQGAPGSVIRFVTEHPEVIKAMREWVKDCQWGDVSDESDIDDMTDEQILRGVQRHYEGGIRAFIRDANSQAEVPVGYKEGVGYVHAKDRAKDPKSIKKPGGGTEHWRIKFQSAGDLKKHGNTEMSKVKETIRELVDEMVDGERLDEVTMPHSQPTPKDARQLWRIVDSLEYGQSISFYNPKNPSSNTTAPWIYIKKMLSHGGGGHEQSGFNLSIEPRMDARTQRPVLKGVENLRSEDDVTEDEVSLALEAVAQNADILSLYYIETEEPAPKKKPYEGDPDHDLGDYEKYGPDEKRPDSSYVQEGKNMKPNELRTLIKESIQEVQSEMHGFEEQQELASMKRIQAYAHWGFQNSRKHPDEMQSLFQKIVKEIDALVTAHEHGHEVPIKGIKKEADTKSPLGVTQETISKTKNLLDQMISQRKKK